MTTLTSQNKYSIYKLCSIFLQEVICSICRVIIQEALKHSTTKTKTLLIYKLSSYNIRQHHEEARLFQNGIHNVALNCCLTRYNIQTNIGINWSISIQRNVKGFCLVIALVSSFKGSAQRESIMRTILLYCSCFKELART